MLSLSILYGCATVGLRKAIEEPRWDAFNFDLLSMAYYSKNLTWPTKTSDLQEMAEEFHFGIGIPPHANCFFTRKKDGDLGIECKGLDESALGDMNVLVQLSKESKSL